MKTNRNNLEIVAQGKTFPTFKEFLQMLVTFVLTVFAWIFFRAENIGHAFSYISEIFSSSLFTAPRFEGMENLFTTSVLITIFLLIEWKGRENQYALEGLKNVNLKPIRWLSYVFILLAIYFYGNFGDTVEFIYFQF